MPLSVPSLGGNESAYLKECIATGWVSSVGPFVDRFECELARLTGAAHAVAVASGTAGLHVALQQAGVQPNDEVLVSTLTFVAPANAIRYCGAWPIFVDADKATWQMDVDRVGEFLHRECERDAQGCINRRTGRRVRAIVPVHILGAACAMEQVLALARYFGLRVVEDACEAIGVRHQGRHPGTFGDFGVLSFNGNKLITCGGGGAVLTDDADAAARLRYLTTQAKDDPVEYVHHEIGYNYRLTNLQAAVGCAQLEQLDKFLACKRAIAGRYEAALRELPELTLMPTPPDTEASYWLYTVLLAEGTMLDERKAVVRALNAQGIGARPLWHPLHGLRPFAGCEALGGHRAMDFHARGLSLPCSVDLTEEDQRRCVDALKQALAGVGA